MKSHTPILYTEDLLVGYKPGKTEKALLEKINISLFGGELVCFLGSNGVGKSTLLRTLAGVQPPLNGKVLLDKKPLHSYSLTERAKKISLVLTDRTSGGNLSVFELIALGRHPHTSWTGNLSRKDYQKIEEAISLTHTEKLADQKVYTLSDGQRQKVMIARPWHRTVTL